MAEPHPRTIEELERENAILREALEKIANTRQTYLEAIFSAGDHQRTAFVAMCRVDNPEV